MNWIKEKNIKFQLKDLTVNQDFTIWKAWDKRNEVVKDNDGNEMQFPIRDGQLVDAQGNVHEFASLRLLKNKEFTELFPLLGRSFKYTRAIIYNGEEAMFGFSKTSNDKIVELIKTVQAMGGDPLQQTFEQTYTASNPIPSKYSVTICADAIPVKPPVNPEGPSISSKEKEVMDAIKSSKGDKVTETMFVEVMKANGIDDARAKELYKLK
jgi:hypothetical protein